MTVMLCNLYAVGKLVAFLLEVVRQYDNDVVLELLPVTSKMALETKVRCAHLVVDISA